MSIFHLELSSGYIYNGDTFFFKLPITLINFSADIYTVMDDSN